MTQSHRPRFVNICIVPKPFQSNHNGFFRSLFSLPRGFQKRSCCFACTNLKHGLLLAIFLVGCNPNASSDNHAAVGKLVGQLTLEPLGMQSQEIPRFEGKVTLLNFWGTWCPPCRRELPGLVRIASRLSQTPRFQLIAISCGTQSSDDLRQIKEETNQYLHEVHLSLDAWSDSSGNTRRTFLKLMGFDSFPTTYLIGPDARVRNVWIGYRGRDEADMAREVVALLKEPQD